MILIVYLVGCCSVGVVGVGVSGGFLRAGLWGPPRMWWLSFPQCLFSVVWMVAAWGGGAGSVRGFRRVPLPLPHPITQRPGLPWQSGSCWVFLFLVYFLVHAFCSQHLTGVSECLACCPPVPVWGWLQRGDCSQFLWWEGGLGGAWHFDA